MFAGGRILVVVAALLAAMIAVEVFVMWRKSFVSMVEAESRFGVVRLFCTTYR